MDGMIGARARWAIAWHSKKSNRYVCKEFDADLKSALEFYEYILNARRVPTLICRNVAFPPPDKYADHEVITTGRGSSKTKVKELIVPRKYHIRMAAMNRKGHVWCPFCIDFRTYIKEDDAMCCPVCGVSHRHGQVRTYNPVMRTMYVNPPRRKYGSKRRRT